MLNIPGTEIPHTMAPRTNAQTITTPKVPSRALPCRTTMGQLASGLKGKLPGLSKTKTSVVAWAGCLAANSIMIINSVKLLSTNRHLEFQPPKDLTIIIV